MRESRMADVYEHLAADIACAPDRICLAVREVDRGDFGSAPGDHSGDPVTESYRGKVATVTEGVFSSGLPYLCFGKGPPLMFAVGGTVEHANPTGLSRRLYTSRSAPFAEHFTVYVTNRRPGLSPASTMSDIAGDYAKAIEDDIGEPVMLRGASTGAAVALQLAIDHPKLVRRLVLAPGACRGSPAVRAMNEEVIRLARTGDVRQAAVRISRFVAPGPVGVLLGVMTWASLTRKPVTEPSDLLITTAAAKDFDVEADLHRVQAPTLVVGGSADPAFSEDLFRRTAAAIPDGRAVIFPGRGHLYPASKPAAHVILGFLLAG